MKICIAVFCLLYFSSAFAQKGDELLVYSLKGNVTVIENNKESRVKIGKVLKPDCTIRTQREAKLTMVCKQGKPILVTKEGSFPVVAWKDSCTTDHNSVTSNYFQYIWDQLYVRSDEYKKLHPGEPTSLHRDDAPVRGNEEMEIVFNDELDTVNYAAGSFPLSWTTTKTYPGKYYFMLFQTKSGKPLYKDSIGGNTISLDKLKRYMRPGNSYGWSVATSQTGISNGGVIKYLPAKSVSQYILSLQKLVDVPEDQAAQYFRIAYLLRAGHYHADALSYYQKAVKADPDVEFYRDKLNEFKNIFLVD